MPTVQRPFILSLPYHVLPTVSRYSQKTLEAPPDHRLSSWAGGMFLVPPVLTLLWPGQASGRSDLVKALCKPRNLIRHYQLYKLLSRSMFFNML